MAIPAAFLVAALTGVLIERTIIRFLYGRPLETLLATFGVSLILQQLVRSIFTALNRSVETPAWMSGTLQLNDALSITYNRLYIVIFTLLVFAALLVVLKYTRIGLEIRAVSQNRAMAKAMGIRSEWVDAMTFGLGSGIAGIAGVALSQLTNVRSEPGAESTSSTRSWWSFSAESGISGAPWWAACRWASSTNSSSPILELCWQRFSCSSR